MLETSRFGDFFEQVHGKRPFPWQEDLAARIFRGEWPSCISLPTASGKTALIDIAVFALACGAPGAARRIFFVVDRRVVVDEAVERAEGISDRLKASVSSDGILGEVARALVEMGGEKDEPLLVATLRGGLPKDDTWTKSPLQPAVCCSTVDQVGSSLLFRAYGSRSNYNWPIRAALTAFDSLIIVDEAHTAIPFLQTLTRVSQYRTWGEDAWIRDCHAAGRTFRVVEMSATPRPGTEPFRESSADWADGILAKRWNASKPTDLVLVKAPENSNAEVPDFSALIEKMSDTAIEFSGELKVIGVVANRVATARRIHDRLSRRGEAILLTGRSRQFDRSELWHAYRKSIELGREQQPEQPIFVVATQCIEVGANIDFDALVTEIAPLDSLEQRFGRLNRDGRPIESRAAIVAQSDQVATKYEDWVYGNRLSETWKWLKEHVGKPSKGKKKGNSSGLIDMGVAALRRVLPTGEERQRLCAASSWAPVLLPAHMDRFSETAPVPAVQPAPELFLHGPKAGPADVLVIWREDLEDSAEADWIEIISRLPPRPEEAVAVPVWSVRRWLWGKREQDIDTTDVEGAPNRVTPSDEQGRRCARWRGPDESGPPMMPGEIRPGDTIVVPSSYGGCDLWGWNPEYTDPVRDVADQVSLRRGKPSLRLHPRLVRGWTVEPNSEVDSRVDELRKAETIAAIRASLKRLAECRELDRVVVSAIEALGKSSLNVFRGMPGADDIASVQAIAAKRDIEQESSFSSYTEEVPLNEHLQHCLDQASSYLEKLGLPERVANSVRLAARYHDIGKADPRFQTLLRGRPAGSSDKLLAKSAKTGVWLKRSAALQASGYPKGARHELQSLAMLEGASVADLAAADPDLFFHLVATHHGRCRPFAPATDDAAPVDVSFGGFFASSGHHYALAGSGVSRRFWRLTRRYGWWGLAYLETVTRLADHRASEAEETVAASEPEDTEVAYAGASD